MHIPKNESHGAWSIVSVVFAISFVYAILRYHLVGDVPWKDVVFYTLNKAFAMGSIVMLSITFAIGPLQTLGLQISDYWLEAKKTLGFMGFITVIIHVFMSLLLFKPSVYEKFFESNQSLTFFAGLSMLGGVLAFVLFWMYNISFNSSFKKNDHMIKMITSRGLILLAMFFSGIHLFFMGFEGWVAPDKWNGGLPPISLLSFGVLAIGLVVNYFGRKS